MTQRSNRRQADPRSGAVARSQNRPARGGWTRWLPWIALVYLLAAGLFVAWAKMETTQLNYEVHQLRSQRTELQRSQRLLSAELAELRSPAYLSGKAAELHLQEPAPGVVRRVE
jgi:hypothetical protein